VDRASDSDSESQGFDSLHAYSFISKFFILGLSWFRHLRLTKVRSGRSLHSSLKSANFKISANKIISFVSRAVKNIKIGQQNSNLLQFAV
jgi:hypothetical protein